jgi:hypothetical protein
MPEDAFTPERIDEIVSQVIAEQLAAYRNIPIVVSGVVAPDAAERVGSAGTANSMTEPEPLLETGAGAAADSGSETSAAAAPPGSPTSAAAGEEASPAAEQQADEPTAVTRQVTVHAVYFINKKTVDAEIGAAREQSGFADIADKLADRLSELNGSDDARMAAGRAVEIGKATPEDVKLFVDQAIAEGAVRQYALGRGMLDEGSVLVGLAEDTLQQVIQGWIDDTRVGVDCSGLANIILVRAREAVRAEMIAAGVPAEMIPPELKRRQYAADGKPVNKPTAMRPGDIWITNEGKHVRLVMELREATDRRGRPVIEFKTAESATKDGLGPTDKTWQTESMAAIQVVRELSGRGSPKDGGFYRVKER